MTNLGGNTFQIMQTVVDGTTTYDEPVPSGDFNSEEEAIQGMIELVRECGFTNLYVIDVSGALIADSDDYE